MWESVCLSVVRENRSEEGEDNLMATRRCIGRQKDEDRGDSANIKVGGDNVQMSRAEMCVCGQRHSVDIQFEATRVLIGHGQLDDFVAHRTHAQCQVSW